MRCSFEHSSGSSWHCFLANKDSVIVVHMFTRCVLGRYELLRTDAIEFQLQTHKDSVQIQWNMPFTLSILWLKYLWYIFLYWLQINTTLFQLKHASVILLQYFLLISLFVAYHYLTFLQYSLYSLCCISSILLEDKRWN